MSTRRRWAATAATAVLTAGLLTQLDDSHAGRFTASYDADGKLTGRPGICMVTRGPGATNASAGLHVAFQDSTPMILFIGQVARDRHVLHPFVLGARELRHVEDRELPQVRIVSAVARRAAGGHSEVELTVTNEGGSVGTLLPQRNFHVAQRQWQSEVAIRTTPVEDLYVVITSFDPDGTASLRAFVNPLTWWIWMGAALLAAGMIFIMAGPSPVAVTAARRAQVGDVAVATR